VKGEEFSFISPFKRPFIVVDIFLLNSLYAGGPT
jgi:hypothetical protein